MCLIALLVCLAAAQAASAPSWRIEAIIYPPGTETTGGALLSAVSCPSKQVCVAVGAENGSGRALIERRVRGVWSQDAVPPGAASDLSGVSCVSQTFCAAVGIGTNAALHWDGSEWQIDRTPPPAHELSAISCTSRSFCIAVGQSYAGSGGHAASLVIRWNGHGWSLQHMPGEQVNLLGVSCTAPTACIAVGGLYHRAVDRWNGKRWLVVPAPHVVGLTAVSCVSVNGCVVVSDDERAARWNGRRWAVQSFPATETVGSVSCLSADSCWVGGRGHRGQAAMEHWDGRTWSVQRVPQRARSDESEIDGLSCAKTIGCTAVGAYYAGSGSLTGALVERLL